MHLPFPDQTFDVITVLGAGTLGAEEALPFSIARSSVRNFK